MNYSLVFKGRAERLAELYEGVGAARFEHGVFPLPGDKVTLRMHPGPELHVFRCTGRHFDFSEAESLLLVIELDMWD